MIARTILYKLDANNKVREWTCWTEDNVIILRHGPIIGQKVFEKITCLSELDADTQAQRRIDKQINRRGYTKDIPTSKPLRPMLCQRVQEHRDKLPDFVIYQPKLDGYRALGGQNYLETRSQCPISAVPQIKHVLNMLPPDVVLDGELYLHNKRFQSIMKTRTMMATEDSLYIEYHVFDIVDENTVFTERRILLSDIILELMDKYEANPFIYRNKIIPFPIMPVLTTCDTVDKMELYYNQFRNEGYEGLIIRNPEAKYEIDIRSYGIFKYKKSDKDWYKVIAIEPGPKDKTKGVLVCVNSRQQQFRVNLKADHTTRSQMLKHPHVYIGKNALIEYFGLTDTGIPRNAVAVEIS